MSKLFPRVALVTAVGAIGLIACMAICNGCTTTKNADGSSDTEVLGGLMTQHTNADGTKDAPQVPSGMPWWGLLIGGVALRTAQSAVTRAGKANWGVIADPEASWAGTAAAVLHNTIGTSSPAEAVARLPAPAPA